MSDAANRQEYAKSWDVAHAYEGSRHLNVLLLDGWEPFHVERNVRTGRITGTMIWLRRWRWANA